MIREAVYLDYLNSLLDGDKAACIRIVDNLLEEGEEVKLIYTDLFQKTMYRIGHLWEKNKASVADEHIASQITNYLINYIYPKISVTKKNGKKAIIACVDKEFHELGPRMVSDFFELNGWDSIFLGSSTPNSDVLKMIRDKKPEVVGLSNNFYINISRLWKLIDDIQAEFPDQKIIVGGQALCIDGSEPHKKFENVTYLPSLDALEEYIKNYV
ncbi:MAG: B12-binding domain-containing protein [bacterium]